jgi:hypothetical protein
VFDRSYATVVNATTDSSRYTDRNKEGREKMKTTFLRMDSYRQLSRTQTMAADRLIS